MIKTNFRGKTITSYSDGEKSDTPVVLLHGFCEDSRMWDEWLPLLPSYRSYLRIDLPGFGNSAMLDQTSISGMAEAVATVLENRNIKKCVLVGHSMGGYVACAFAKNHGQMLKGLCMFHSHPFADSEEKKAGRLKAIDFIEKNGHVLFVRQLIPKLFAYDYSKGYQAEVNRMIYYASKYAPEAIIASLHAMRDRPDLSGVLKEIHCPVQFFIGQQDAAIPYETSLRQTHLPAQADLQIYEDVGHMGMFKSPRKTAKAFRKFLSMLNGEN
ncbi:MAG: alpha/beta hydrolase [Bacteroidota bacterium]